MAQNVVNKLIEKGADTNKIVDMLNKAYADEYLAWYQYLAPIGVAKGLFRSDIEKEFEEHAKEELQHAQWLKERIIQLNGIPLLSPQEWYNETNCGFTVPSDFNTNILVSENLKSEQCAENVYLGIMEATKDLDPVTYHLARKILQEEEQHEQDLQDFLTDMSI